MEKYTLEYYFSPKYSKPIKDEYHSILIDTIEKTGGFVDRIAEDLMNNLAPLEDLIKIDFKSLDKKTKHSKLIEILGNNGPLQYKVMVEKDEIIPANIALFRLAMKSEALARTLYIDHYIN